MKNLILPFLFFFSFIQFATSQENCNRLYFGANYVFFQPLQDLEAGGFNNGHGVSFDIFYNLSPAAKNTAFHIGLRANTVIGNSSDSGLAELAEPEGANGSLKVYNAIGDFRITGRSIFIPNKRISPYLEASIGWRISAGHEKIELNDNYPGYEPTISNQVISRGNGVVGGGIGTLINFHPKIDLDLRFTADYSPELEYININSYENDDINVNYDFSTSSAFNYNLYIGLRIKIGCEKGDKNSYKENDSRLKDRTKKTPQRKTPNKGVGGLQ